MRESFEAASQSSDAKSPSNPGDSKGGDKEEPARPRPKYLWGDDGDPEIGFIGIGGGQFRMIVQSEPLFDFSSSDDRTKRECEERAAHAAGRLKQQRDEIVRTALAATLLAMLKLPPYLQTRTIWKRPRRTGN